MARALKRIALVICGLMIAGLGSGAGRVVVSGEAALFTAQVDPPGRRFGMNRADTDDRQFLLNILHWLSRADG